MKQNQILEVRITAQRPYDAKLVSEQELDLIGVFLSEMLVEMLQHLDQEE